VVAGVCGGLARYFNIDPTIIRVVFVIAVLLGGLSIFAYIISIFIIPEEPLHSKFKDHQDDSSSFGKEYNAFSSTSESESESDKGKRRTSTEITIGIVITLIGLFALFSSFGWFSIGQMWRYLWPGLIVLVGVAILFGSFKK